MSIRDAGAVFVIGAIAFTLGCASTREDTSMSQTAERESRAGTGVLVVQNQTDEAVEVWADETFVGSVAAGEGRRFPEMPLQPVNLTARSSSGTDVIDSESVDFAGVLDSTITFVVDGR